MDLILQVVSLAYIMVGTYLACDVMDACVKYDHQFSFFENWLVNYVLSMLVVVGWGVVFFWVFFREKK